MDTGTDSYRRYLSGDDTALGEIVSTYADGLFFYINSIVKNASAAEELTQETFVKLVIKRPRFFGRGSFKGWLYTIGRNLAVDSLRARGDTPVSLEELEDFTADPEDTEKRYFKDEDALALHQAVKKLKSEHAQALRLVYFENFTVTEAARIMKRSRHAFENLLSRAKASLKREMEKEGYVYGL